MTSKAVRTPFYKFMSVPQKLMWIHRHRQAKHSPFKEIADELGKARQSVRDVFWGLKSSAEIERALESYHEFGAETWIEEFKKESAA